MPNIADLLSSQLPNPDPSDMLRDPLGQGQTLQGLEPQPGQGAAPPPQTPPGMGGPPGMVPSANVAGPLAALAGKTPGKPRIRLLPKKKKLVPVSGKPHIKLKASPNGLV
jgi:hypothetical protein